MTREEQKTIDTLLQVVRDLREENRVFREQMTARVEKTEKIQQPVSLEQDILRTAQVAMQDAISKALTAYHSPLQKLSDAVVTAHQAELREMMDAAFVASIRSPAFAETLHETYAKQLARTLIADNASGLQKVSNNLKQDAKFRAQLTLLVAQLVEDFTKNINPE